MKLSIKIIAVFLLSVALQSCADLHRSCAQYVERAEVQEVCLDVSDEIDCTHEHGGVEHQCTANFSEIGRVCHTENVTVKVCTRYVCKAGYHKNSKNRCVKIEKK